MAKQRETLLDQQNKQALHSAQQATTSAEHQLDQARQQVDAIKAEVHQVAIERVQLATQLQEEKKANADRQRYLEQDQEKLKNEFSKIASRLLVEKNQQLTENNQSLLEPLREQLHQFRSRVDAIHTSEVQQQASLQTEIRALRQLNHQITQETQNLTKALKGEGSSQKQGTWGELMLERLLEQSGLSKGREYEIQRSFANEEGKTQRPDVIVHLPDNKDVIIDAKVSINAYARYHDAEDETQRDKAMGELTHAIRHHITTLAERDYSQLLEGRSLDLVLMFVPNEGAYVLALSQDPQLFEFAFAKRVALIGPSTLPSTLKIIHYLWRSEDQNRNAKDIAHRAGNLYDKLRGLIEDLDRLENHLNRSQITLADAKGKLYKGRGNLVGRVEEFRKMGVTVKKSIENAEAALTAPDDDSQS